jgi:hypothetical protein
MGASDLRVTVEGAKLRCVLDPALALGHAAGPLLALGLTRVFETWLTRSFWQVLDASELLSHRALRSADSVAATPDADALGEWIALRDGTDAASWVLRWVGDNLAESQLRAAGDDGLVERFEWFAASLAACPELPAGACAGWRGGIDPLAGALDAIALSAALDGALILCRQPAGDGTPWPVQALARLGMPAPQVAHDDESSLFAAERQVVRMALASAGLAALLQTIGPLAVVHVLASPAQDDDASARPWAQAGAWWYAV